MRVQLATLCDFAAVREGLLTVVSGGATQLTFPAFPAPLTTYYAAIIEVAASEVAADGDATAPFDLSIYNETGQVFASIQAELSGQVFDLDDQVPIAMPMAMPLPFLLPMAGAYSLELRVGSAEPFTIAFRAIVAEYEDAAVTWDNIEGLTPEERALFKMMVASDDLSTTTITGSSMNGVRLPDIVNGKVRRPPRAT